MHTHCGEGVRGSAYVRAYVATRTTWLWETEDAAAGTRRWHSSNLSAVLCRLINRLPDYHASRATVTVASGSSRAPRARVSTQSTACARAALLCLEATLVLYTMHNVNLWWFTNSAHEFTSVNPRNYETDRVHRASSGCARAHFVCSRISDGYFTSIAVSVYFSSLTRKVQDRLYIKKNFNEVAPYLKRWTVKNSQEKAPTDMTWQTGDVRRSIFILVYTDRKT